MYSFVMYMSVAVLILPRCRGANILAIVPTPSYSHQVAFTSLWTELSLRGHQVTVLTTDPQNNSTLTNLTEIDLRMSYEHFKNVSKMVENSMTMWNAFSIFTEIMGGVAEGQLSNRQVLSLIEGQQHFDVVLVEGIHPQFLIFAEIYKCPKIVILSLEATTFIHGSFGNPTHPVLYPEPFTSFHGDLNFGERLMSTIFNMYTLLHSMPQYNGRQTDILNKHFETKSTVEDLIRDADMLFLNTNPILQPVRALGPSTITIGGYERNTSKVPLPNDVQKFLDNAKEGFIYFSLGSNVKSKDLKRETLEAIIDTLKSMPYKVLWKFEAAELHGKPDNVQLIKWSPQQSVLAHPNIKLFVTQGGVQSMEEAIFSEVPLVVIPFFADQENNAKLMKSKGIALTVEVRPYLNKDDLKSAMLEVIKNPKYRNAVKRLKQLILDVPITGLEKAVWWTEYVIRNKGAKHLRNPAVDIPFYQYYLLDVIGFLLTVAVVIIYVTVKILTILYRFISSRIGVNPITTKKKIT